MITYDFILSGYEVETGREEQTLIDTINGLCWGEIEQNENPSRHSNYILTHNGIDAFYQYGADYYYFTDAEVDK